MKREVVGGKKRPDVAWNSANSALTKQARANARPGYVQQFVREDEVYDKMTGDYFRDPITGEEHEIGGWNVVKDKRRVENTERYGAGTDTTARQGNMVLMDIPEADFKLLEAKSESQAAVREYAMMRGSYAVNEYADGVNTTFGDPRAKGHRRGFIPHQALENAADITE